MKLAKIISVLSLLVMTAGILNALATGDLAVDGAALLSNPWGIVSMVDLYTGFILFSMWIVFREKAVLPSILWVVLMMTLGFWTGALYTAIALFTCGGDWRRFWMGKRA